MIIKQYKVLLGLLLCVPFCSKAQTLQDTLNKIDALFEHVNQQTPGVSVLVSRNGQILYHKHKGMADLEHSTPITDSTRIEAGSVSKQFTATAVLILVQDGKIGLDDDVRKYIPELPGYEKTITVRHLLNHTSGLKDWGVVASLGGWPRGTRVYTNELALNYIVKQPTLNNVPGDEYLYSNSNYTLLTLIVERVSGKKLADFTQERIFKPLGMHATSWRTDFQDIVPHRAIGYDKTGRQYQTVMPFENTYGHAALLTTVADLDKWNTSWKNSPLGGDRLLKLRIERGVLNNGDTIRYAGGVFVDTYNGHPMVSHTGATAGYRAVLSYFPETSLSIVYLSNDASLPTSKMGNGIAAIFFGKKQAISASEKKISEIPKYLLSHTELMEFQGRYVSAACEGELVATIENETTLTMTSKSNRKRKLKPTAKDMFSQGAETSFLFKRDEQGKIKGFYVSVPRARNVWFERVDN